MADKKFIPQFTDPASVIRLTDELQKAEAFRAQDRALIDDLANGRRPYTNDEAEKYQIHVNVNWLEMTNDLMDANTQVNSALIFKKRFFQARCMEGPVEKRQKYAELFTQNMHKYLKRGKCGKRHINLMKSRNAAMTLHGRGVVMWMNSFTWLPRYIALEDILIPTDTLCDFSNLNFFALNLYLTVAEFFEMTYGEKVDKGWNKKAAARILDDLVKPEPTGTNEAFTMVENPEKRIQWLKQNRTLYDADTTKTVKLRMVFYLDPSTHKWHRCAVLREPMPNQPQDSEWIYDGRDTPFADDIDHFLFVIYGDNNLCPPLKYHSVRGLGVMLYGPAECNNRLRCETVQHTLANLKTLMRISNPPDQDRPKMFDMSQYSVVPDGVSIVPNNERHQIDPRLVQFAMSQMRQIMSENAANYVQDIGDGQSKQPLTAAETQARVQGVNVKVSGMLSSCYEQETFYFEELVRRFLDKKTGDPEVKKFQKKCRADGIPDKLMKPDVWEVEPERVLGSGDQFIATQEANSLLSQSQRFDPSAQRLILRKWVNTTTRDPALGDLLVPEKPQTASDGVIAAEDVFGTLMQGIPASIREGIERSDYIEALLGMLKAKVQMLAQTETVPPYDVIVGMQRVVEHCKQNLQILAGDQSQQSLVKELGDMLAQLERMVTMFMERFQEQMENQQPDPETDAKVQSMILQSQTKAQISEQTAQQKMQQKQAQFEQKMQQDMQRHAMEMQKLVASATLEIQTEQAKAATDINASRQKAEAEAEIMRKKAAAQPATSVKKD